MTSQVRTRGRRCRVARSLRLAVSSRGAPETWCTRRRPCSRTDRAVWYTFPFICTVRVHIRVCVANQNRERSHRHSLVYSTCTRSPKSCTPRVSANRGHLPASGQLSTFYPSLSTQGHHPDAVWSGDRYCSHDCWLDCVLRAHTNRSYKLVPYKLR